MFASFFTGSKRAARSFKLLGSLFLFNLLFALPLIIPIFGLIQLSTTNRLAARTMLANQLDPTWLIDSINNRLTNSSLIGFATETFIQLFIIACAYLFFNLMLTGGILGYYTDANERFSLRRFWAFGGAFFWRFVRLLLYAAPFYGLVWLVYRLSNRFLNVRLAQLSALGNYPWYKLSLLVAALLGMALVNMVFDYARIHTVIQDQRSMWRATLAGWRFGLRHFFTAYPLYLLIAGLGFAVFLLLTWLRETVIQDGMFAVGLATAFGHVAILTRVWSKLALAAGQIHFYQLHQPVTVAATEMHIEHVFEFRAATSTTLDPAVLARAEAAYAETIKPVPTTAALPAATNETP